MGRAEASRSTRAIANALCIVLLWWGAAAFTLGDAPTAAQSIGVRVPILVYHNIDYSGSAFATTPELLDAECKWLIENGYSAISLWQFWDAIQNGAALPPNPVMLTNDDGWSSAVTFADTLAGNGLVGNYFINNYSPLTADQIYRLTLNGPVQAHTATHQWMSQLDADRQYQEIADNMAFIEGITGSSISFLAWPFGDVNAGAIDTASSLGIVAGFGLGGTPAYVGAVDPFNIPRIMMVADDTLDTFIAKVTGW